MAGELNGILSDWLTEQLGDRADPMDEVVSAGLPAVRRLEGVIAELAEEAIQNEKAESLG